MKKQHHKKKRHRNNGSGAAVVHPRPRSYVPRLSRRNSAPDWKSIGAALAGGAGGAALGGLIVHQKILSPEAVGVGLMLGGGATAYFGDGTTRVVGTSLAAAGAGQLALSFMAKQAIKGAANQNASQPTPPQSNQSAQPAAQPTAPAQPVAQPPRQSANEGGIVVELFRDSANELDMLDDELRFSMRDDAEPFVIDLDEVA